MHQFNKILSSAGHTKCNQSAIARMAMRHRCVLLLSGKAFKMGVVSLKEKEVTEKNQTDAAFTEPDVSYTNKSHKQ